MHTSTSSTSRSSVTEDGEYQELVQQLRGVQGWPLFTTDASGLYDAFLETLPRNRRQHYTCRACRKFVDKFGGLVTIDASDMYSTTSMLWAVEPEGFFEMPVSEMRRVVENARVTGVFLNSDDVWGLVENRSPKAPNADGKWHHMHVKPTGDMLRRNRNTNGLLNDEQLMAEKLQDFGTLSRGLDDFNLELVRKAHTLLTSGSLYRSEKCIGVAKWLLDLHEALSTTKHKVRRENLVWRAVALAPPGFCHVRSTMIGALLTDLEAGKDFAEIKAAFDAKLSPIQYQRPQAAPTDGQLAAAEAVISKLASAGSLERRFARLEEVLPHAIWVPKAIEDKSEGVFGHLKGSAKKQVMDLPSQTITWDKFNWTVLPDAERVELLVPHGAANFFAFTTAENAEAPPILQWDSEEKRNPVSWYLYMGGSMANWWGLTANQFCDVVAITSQPSGWNDKDLRHQGDGAYFLLRGARDQHYARAGIGLFPETLRAEYRGIRSAIEAFSKSKTLGGIENATACGVALQKASGSWGYTFRVTAKGTRLLYKVDRWD
jgi:hypothetical protein